MTDELRERLTARWNEGCVTPDEPSDETLMEYADALRAEGEAI